MFFERIIPVISFGVVQEFECKLALSRTSKAMQDKDMLIIMTIVKILAHFIKNFLSSCKEFHWKWTYFVHLQLTNWQRLLIPRRD